MLIRGRLGEVEHRDDAGIASGEHGGPFAAGTRCEHPREPAGQFVPPGPVVLVGEVRIIQSEPGEQRRVEPGLDGADRHVAPIGGRVGAIEGSAPIEQVVLPVEAPEAGGEQAVEHGREQRRPVEHRGVDHLAGTVLTAGHQGRTDSNGEQHASSAEVGDQVERRRRRAVRRPDRMERTCDSQIVDVVSGGRGTGAVLTPSGEPPIDQTRVALMALLGTHTEPFHHPGPESLDEHVTSFHQAQEDIATAGMLQIDGDRPRPAPLQRIRR